VQRRTALDTISHNSAESAGWRATNDDDVQYCFAVAL
jgi:hypothetical protein